MTAEYNATEPDRSLRVFVAMPGSNMGDNAAWQDPGQIKRRLYEKVGEALEKELGRTVELVVEKDKYRSGSIYSSMYSEAWTADVYLVDLTGANANVYLELGVRWAMSDGVTVLLAQDPSKLPFNVVAARAQPYSSDPDFLENSIGRIVRSVIEGLAEKARGETDSPVREGGKIRSILVDELIELQSELECLRAERGEDYLEAAALAPTLQTKIDLLQRAVEVNPLVAESRFQLGQALRETGGADAAAVEQLVRATQLSPETARYWREFGIALSKSGQLSAAIPALERCIKIDPSDFEAISVLGGAKRRLALKEAPDLVDWELLRESRNLYSKASEIAPRDTYPLLNIARLDLLLSRVDVGRMAAAEALFRKTLPLCLFALQDTKENAEREDENLKYVTEASYKAFDYADCILYSGQIDAGLAAYREAIDYVPTEIRSDILRSVAAGLNNVLELVDFGGAMSEAIRNVYAMLADA